MMAPIFGILGHDLSRRPKHWADIAIDSPSLAPSSSPKHRKTGLFS